jgi:hypothetical protein
MPQSEEKHNNAGAAELKRKTGSLRKLNKPGIIATLKIKPISRS